MNWAGLNGAMEGVTVEMVEAEWKKYRRRRPRTRLSDKQMVWASCFRAVAESKKVKVW